MQVNGLIGILAREGFSSYSLTREVGCRDMTEPTPTRARRFADIVVPAAERAGYTGHGAKARFARDTGMPDSSVTRLWQGTALPDAKFYEAIASVTGISLGVLLIEGLGLSPESLQSLSETDRSHVRSTLTPQEAADRLGIKDEVGREVFYATIDRLKRLEDDDAPDRPADHGGTAAQM
jgi:transcriptional regulator with XRE-family HTH domain